MGQTKGDFDLSLFSVAAARRQEISAACRGQAVITVVVAVGVRLFREGLSDVLGREPAVTVVAAAADVAAMDDDVRTSEPDVLLVDVALPGARSAVLRLIAALPALKVVALGEFQESDEVIAYAEAGVAGFVTRDQALDELVATLESVVRGHLHCPPHIAAALLQRVASVAARRSPMHDGRRGRLTVRELEIVALLESGLSNKQIAGQLSIEVPTVKNHVHNILEKLQVSSRADAASWARGA